METRALLGCNLVIMVLLASWNNGGSQREPVHQKIRILQGRNRRLQKKNCKGMYDFWAGPPLSFPPPPHKPPSGDPTRTKRVPICSFFK